jgi:hypothetical protein
VSLTDGGFLLPEKLLSIFRKEKPAASAGSPRVSVPGSLALRKATESGPVVRQSRGLEQFFFSISDLVGLSILDLAGASQENITYLTSLGHKVYSEDLVRGLNDTFGMDPSEQTNAGRIDQFLRAHFEYASETFDGVLLWDSLQFMGPALLTATVDRLHDIMRPGSYLLAYFTANEKMPEVSSHFFRLVDNKTLTISDRGIRSSGQVFNNRNLEKLFGKFESVKFFLTKENLREVIVKR